jgi:hypothetical protein
MYLFYPHGSRKISDVQQLNDRFGANMIYPIIMCHDQEPLNYQLYLTHHQQDIDCAYEYFKHRVDKNTLEKSNLSLAVNAWLNLYDKIILLHSEKNSKDLEWYESQQYIGVHYWCHAILARDWYRFAEFDHRLQKINHKKDFLIYSRDWTGSREYRIKFQELLHQHHLVANSVTSVKKINSEGCSLENFTFENKNFSPTNIDFFNNLDNNLSVSWSSADYCVKDFNSTKISVVLETVFDGDKIHLTEKTVRPLACGHPFMIAAGPRSLEYLKSYGFKTFSPWIDESYDLEQNTVLRLEKIIHAMKQFNNLNTDKKNQTWQEIKKIANYNKNWFFSKQFTDVVHGELKSNLLKAVNNITGY